MSIGFHDDHLPEPRVGLLPSKLRTPPHCTVRIGGPSALLRALESRCGRRRGARMQVARGMAKSNRGPDWSVRLTREDNGTWHR
jgi:hypothetical protein